MPIRVRLYADFCDWPLWGPRGGPLAHDDLLRSEPLKYHIKAWFNAYDRPRPEWPLWMPPDGTLDVEQAWVDEGVLIAGLIATELGPDYQVTYDA
jgi:hypothetical protein